MDMIIQQTAVRSLQSIHASISGSFLVAGSNHRCRGCNSVSAGASVSIWKRVSLRESNERRVTSCQSSGGSRRDEAKIVARTQKRRSRHVKGVTPTKPELFSELQAEEEADEELERFQAGLEEESGEKFDTSDDSEGSSEESTDSDEDMVLVEKPVVKGEVSNGKSKGNGEVSSDERNVDLEKRDKKSSSQVEEVIVNGDNTYTIMYFPDQKSPQAGEALQDAVESASSTTQEAVGASVDNSRELGDNVRENTEDVVRQAGEVAGEVSDIAQDTAADVTDTAQEAADETGKNLQEAGDVVRENVEDGAQQLGTTVGEVADIAQDTAQDVATTAQETAEEAGKSLGEAGDAVLESVEAVGSEGQKLVQEGQNALGEQFEEGRKDAEANLSKFQDQAREAGDRSRKGFEKVTDEASKSFQNVQESLAAVFEDSSRAAGTIGSEALRMGEVLFTAAGEASGFTSGGSNEKVQGKEEESMKTNGSGRSQAVKGKQEGKSSKAEEKPNQTAYLRKPEAQNSKESRQPDQAQEEDTNPYKGFKVTVAGASGRTGRLVVEELASKGVPVRAFVRDKNKSESRALMKLSNVEVVQVDLYKYEAAKKALGDSNVVICAIGARSFPFDPIGTYQAEFEGVKNLVAAAKNKGDVRKFVFITSLGVTFLQLVPLIFWKKQAELYLQRSGLDYTIVRPGGLTNGTGRGREVVTFKPADTQFGGAISRKKVAEVCVAALVTPSASEKIVEVISGGGAEKSMSDLFESV